MHTLSLRFLLILSQLLGCSYCFLPTRSSAVLETDFTMEDVIRKGMSNFTLEDAGADIELDDAKSREDAVTEIVEYFNTAERVHHGNPAWSFANEKILEGHGLLVSLRDRLIQTLLPHKPSYRAARETLGQIFHLLLKFYSNTNWVELGHTEIFKNLGIPDRPLMPVAPPSVDTCVACGEAVHRSCRHNILTDKFLTSGYFGQKQKGYYPLIDSTVQSHGKCRHGGVHDGGSSHTAVPGGINKQSECPEFSPHYFLHKNASMLATQHVRFYLFDQVYGLYHLLGHENFNQLLTVDLEASSVFVDVENETVRHELVQSLQSSEMHVLDTTSLEYACVHNEGTIIVVRYIDSSSKIQRNGPWQCDTRNIRVYNIQVLETVNSDGKFYLIVDHDTSGGTVYETTKTNIAAVVDIIKESVSTKPPVTVLKFKLLSSSSNEFKIPVDNLIQNLTIKVQGSSASVPGMNLYRPSGTQESFSNSSVAKQQTLGSKLRVIHVYKPTPGIWKMKRMSSLEADVDVTASTDLQFSYQFMQPGPGGFGDYPLIGRPIAGENTTVQVSVPLVDKIGSVDRLLLVDRNGNIVYNSSLQNVGGRRGRSLFKTHIVIPTKEFEVAVEGMDTSGNTFRRLDPKITSALGIQLEVLPSSGTLYINQSITLPYRVKNVGAGTATIKVSITDDKGFAQSPTSNTYPVPSNGTKRGSFVLKAGPIKGETTTVTISAKATGSANNKVQYNVQRITVEEKIIRVIDKTAPICNVTSIKGKCDFGADICQCSRQTWEMKAIVGDNGDGLLSVFSSGAGPNSTFTNDSFSVGHKLSNGVIHTTLSADCCHQKAKITVVDLAGNVGLCDVVITPGFVAPDPNLCISPVSSGKTKPVQTNANITSITCNITNIIDTCNGSSSGTGKACENEFWSTEAELGDEGFGRIQVAAVNAGRHANLTKLNNTVMLSTDCCHPDVYINVVDIAGHTGQCHAKIAVVTDRPKPVQTNANITSITCNITNIIDTCNGSSSGTGKACENEFWSTEAELGDEGFGRIQVAAVNAGRHANLTKLNNTVMLSTDCCHPDVYINVVDIAGHTGQCHAKIAVVTDTPKTSLDQSGSDPPPIGIIAGGAAGGIAVTGAVVGLVYYLKTRATAGKVGQDANAVTPAS